MAARDNRTALLRVTRVLGHMNDGDWTRRLQESRVDVLHLDQAEAQRSRLRRRSAGGADVAISLERGMRLRDGDVLAWEEHIPSALVARVDLQDVMVLDLGSLLDEPAETLLSRCVEVGHAIGNQHWPAVVKASQVYVPLTVSQQAMEAVMQAHRLEGVAWRFARGAGVMPYLSPHEARRLFGGSQGHTHSGDPVPPRPEAE